MPEVYGIRYEYPQILTLEFVKANGFLWNDDDFSFDSYWEGDINNYERLFYKRENNAEPFTGLIYELYSDGTLLGYSEYVSGYKENENVEFYPNGQVKKYMNFCKKELKTLILEWYENEQICNIKQLTDHGCHKIEVEYDSVGNIINHQEI